jgi:hypothetical protein
VAVGESVADLARFSPENVQPPLSPSTASSADDGGLSVPLDKTELDVDDELFNSLDAGAPLDDKLIHHSLQKLADMAPCTVRALESSGKTAPDSYC